jgi:hypothetical protein
VYDNSMEQIEFWFWNKLASFANFLIVILSARIILE